MNESRQKYSEKYLQLSIREQYLILLTGLVVLFFSIFHLFVDPSLITNKQVSSKIERLTKSNQSLKISMAELEAALQEDPNEAIRKKIAQFEAKLAKVNANLLTLTSDLINPVQMRHALFDLLKLEKGVSLLSFELLGAQPLLALQSPNEGEKVSLNQQSKVGQNLYQHGIKIKLSGGYFELQNYLAQLEQLPWTFFWQEFDFKLSQYPKSELEIIIYSLSTHKEFVGV
jgi:MSHA biogenesis protein MshJ